MTRANQPLLCEECDGGRLWRGHQGPGDPEGRMVRCDACDGQGIAKCEVRWCGNEAWHQTEDGRRCQQHYEDWAEGKTAEELA